MQDLLTTKADEMARSCVFVRSRRKVSGANFAQTVVFTAMADADATESRLHCTAAAVGLNASRQALDKRFNARGAEFLRELLRAAVAEMVASPVAIPLLQRFTSVEALDSSIIALSDELADLNYFCLAKFARWQQCGAYWLSRLKSGTKVYDVGGRRIDLVAALKAAGADDVDLDVGLGVKQRLACRLIARRVPADVADQRRQRLLDKSKRRGDRPSALSLALCDWTVLVTNLPRELLTVEEAIALARIRWQIELIFKLWKSRGGIDRWRSSKSHSALCEMYGKLLAQVVRHWVIVVGAWSRRDRSLTKAAEIVAAMAMSLATAMDSVRRLCGVLRHARQIMEIAARMDKRCTAPNAYDVIFCLDQGP